MLRQFGHHVGRKVFFAQHPCPQRLVEAGTLDLERRRQRDNSGREQVRARACPKHTLEVHLGKPTNQCANRCVVHHPGPYLKYATSVAQFSAPLHLWRLSLHHGSTLFCCGSSRVVERSDSITSSHPMIPVLCLVLRSSHARLPTHCIVHIFIELQSLQLAMLPARSELSAIQQSSILNCALCPQSSCHSNTEFFNLGDSSF